MRKRWRAALLALVVLVVVAVAVVLLFPSSAVRFALTIVGPLTGYNVRAGDVRFESHHGALVDVHVSRGGQPVLDAQRIDIYYNPRDLLPGSRHRYGLTAVTIDRPQITIVHNLNGTYNISVPKAVSGGTRPQGPMAPLDFTIRVRNASATLIDQYRYYKESRTQSVNNINVDMAINTVNVTRYLFTGDLEDSGPQPFRMAGTIDYVRGYALHHISVTAIPITTIGNYFINSNAAHILGGTVRGFDMHAWAYDVKPNQPAAYHMAGSGYLREGLIQVPSLNSPIQHINGGITVFDSGFAAKKLTALVGHIPISFAGGIFDFKNPQFRLGVEGRGDLRNLQEIAKFAHGLPIYGSLRIHALIEGDITNPVLMIGYDGRRFNYQNVPIDNPRGAVALYKNNLVVLPFHGSYSGINLHVQGNLVLGKQVQSILALHAIGPSSQIPYLGALVAKQPIDTEVLMSGTDLKVAARGYVASLADLNAINGFFSIDRNGNGGFGPISLTTPGGGTLVAAFQQDRLSGNSAFWASVDRMRLRQPRPIDMPGVNIPELPPIDANIVEANLAGAGAGHDVVIGGSAYLSPATIVGIPFTTIAARFAGPFAAAKMSSVHADGPWGRFDGNGTFGASVIVARGGYSGTLQGLRNFIGDFPARGDISGPMAIAISQGKIYVQAQNAQLVNATIHGMPIQSITGTMAFQNNVLRVYSAQARAAGGTVVAAGSFATGPTKQSTRMALATTTLDAGTLHGAFGVPIARGQLQAVGAVAPGAAIPNLDAGVVLRNGSASGYGPFSATAEVAIANDALHVRDGLAGLGTTIAHVNGSIGGIAAGVPRYDITTEVPAGAIAPMAALAGTSTFNADGSFGGNIHVSGSGTNPAIEGVIDVPVGEVNGLGFRDAHARISLSRAGASAQGGTVQVGSTNARFSATVARDEAAFSMLASRADLADFNDYFNTGDTLAGKGYVALSFSHFDDQTYSSGDIDVFGLRYRQLPIGDTKARWTSFRNAVRGNVAVGGEHGLLQANGTIAFAQSTQLAQVVERSRYNINAQLSNLDLTTWLPAIGFPQLPVTGRVDASAHVVGSYPHLGVTGAASLRNGTIGPATIQQAEVGAQTISGDRIQITHMIFALPGMQASGNGIFGLSPNAPLQMQVHATTDDLPRLVAQVSKKPFNVTGRVESTLTIGGTFKSPTFVAGVDASNINAYGVKIPSFIGQIQLHRRNIVVRNAEVLFPTGNATLAGSLPLQLQPFAFGPLNAPISMDLVANGLDLSTFAPLMGNGTKLTGTLTGHVGISGSVRDPRIVGQLAAANGSYVSALELTPITQTVAQMTFEGTRATLDQLHAMLGRGTLDGSGTLNFGGGISGGPLSYAIALKTRGAQIDMPAFGSGTFESSIALDRTGGKTALLHGNVEVHDALMPFNAFLKFGGGGNGEAPAGPPFNLAFDLGITAGKNVRVRGGGAGIFGLDISGEGKAHLGGTLLGGPVLDGRFNSAGGTLTYIDHTFKVQTGNVTFTPANGVIPDVYAVANTRVVNPDPNVERNPTGAVDITATVTGPVTNPKIAFQSSPGGYTEQQILALLLPFGGLIGPIQFTDTGVILPPGQLAGAPQPGTGAILPDILVRRENGTLTIGQEAFNILNAQFASGILAPVESALGSTLGLSDVNLTVDYSGAFGISLRRLLSGNVYALYGTTFAVPVRQTFGVSYQPNAFTSAQFTMFVQQGATPLFQSPGQVFPTTNIRVTAGQAVQGSNGFTFLFQRLF